MTTKLYTIAHVPEGLLQAWLQHLRDFDVAHPDCHFEVAIDAPEATLAEMIETLRMNPGLDFMQVFERQPAATDEEVTVRETLAPLLGREAKRRLSALTRIVMALNRRSA